MNGEEKYVLHDILVGARGQGGGDKGQCNVKILIKGVGKESEGCGGRGRCRGGEISDKSGVCAP